MLPLPENLRAWGLIQHNEGYRAKAYDDRGVPAIGHGVRLAEGDREMAQLVRRLGYDYEKLRTGKQLLRDEADAEQLARLALKRTWGELPESDQMAIAMLPARAQAAVLDFLYNSGSGTYSKFRGFRRALAAYVRTGLPKYLMDAASELRWRNPEDIENMRVKTVYATRLPERACRNAAILTAEAERLGRTNRA